MATITKLSFTIDSKYDSKGLQAARGDLKLFNEELRKVSGKNVQARVNAIVDNSQVNRFHAQLRELSGRRVEVKVAAVEDTNNRAVIERFKEKMTQLSNNTYNVRIGVGWMAQTIADLKRFEAQLRRLDGQDVKVDVKAQIDPILGARFQAELNEKGRLYHVPVRVRAGDINGAGNDRTARIRTTESGAASANARIDAAARNRRSIIDVDVTSAIMNMRAMTTVARYAGLAVMGIVAAFYTLGAVGAVVGAALSAALAVGVVGGAAAIIAANDKLQDSYANTTRNAQKAADSARMAYGQAVQNAQSTAAAGVQRVATAQRQALKASEDLEKAQKDLGESFKDATRDYEDMVAKLRGAPVDETGAMIAVERARERMRELGQDGEPVTFLDMAEAQNDIDQAILNLEEVRRNNNRLREDVDEANQKGIEGSDAVVNAKQRVRDAEEAERDAVEGVTRAREEAAANNARAQEDVIMALQRVNDAEADLTDALEKQNGVLSQVSRFWAGIVEPLRGPLTAALDDLTAKFRAMAPELTGMFVAATPLIQPMVDTIVRFTQAILPGMTQALSESTSIIEGMRDGLETFAARLGNMFTGLTAGAAGLGDTWRVAGNRFGEFLQILGEGIGRTASDGAKSLDLMFQGINNLVRGLYDGIAPALQASAGGASVWYSIFTAIGNFFREIGGPLGQFTEALGGALGPVLEKLATSGGQVFGAFLASLTPIIISLTPFIVTLADSFSQLLLKLEPIMPVLGPVIAGIWALNVALTANPIGLAIVAIAALAAGIYWLSQNMDVVAGLWERFAPQWLQDWFKKGEDGASGFSNTLERVKNWGQQLWDLFGGSFSGVWDALKGAWEDIKTQWETSLKPALQDLWNEIKPLAEALKPVLAVIGAILLAVINVVIGIFEHSIKPIANFVMEVLTAIIDGIKGVIKVITGMINTIVGVIELIWNIGKTVVGFFNGLFTGDWSMMKDGARGIVDAVKKIFVDGFWNIVEGAVNIIVAMWDAIFGIFRGVFGTLGGIVRGIIEGVIGFFQWLFDVLVGHSIIPDLINAIVDWFGRLPGMLLNGLKWLVERIVDGFQWLWDRITEIWNKLWDWVGEKATSAWNWIKGKWEEFTGGISFILENWREILSVAWENLWNGIRDKASNIWDVIRQKFEDFKEGLRIILEAIVTKAGEIWDKIKGIFATPINFVIDIWNNHVADKIGLGDKKLERIPGYASGGMINGRGGGREDAIPAWVSHGEYIVNARAAFRNREVLDAINYGDVELSRAPAFREGGPVEWMQGWVKEVSPQMQATSTYRTTNDYHGQGKAVDFAMSMDPSGLSAMMSLAQEIASTWGSKTLELIHGNGFKNNIDSGMNVGDGMGFFGASTMAQHNNHVHWAVDRPLDDKDRGGVGGIVDGIGNVIGGIVGRARELVSDIFARMTQPILDGIPSPFAPGMGEDFGAVPKGMATHVRDGIAEFIKGREGQAGQGTFSANMGGTIPTGERLAIIEEALRITNTPPPSTKEAWLAGMNTLIERESGWNPNARNDWDSNAAQGIPSQGLAQTIPPTFNAHKVPGYDNILGAVDNVAASINYIKSRYKSIEYVQQANANLPPKGYADGTKNASPGWHLVGEQGPEMVKFNGGEQVMPADETAQMLQRVQKVGAEKKIGDAVGGAVKSSFDTFAQDLTGGSVEGGFLGNLFKESINYGQTLGEWAQNGQGIFGKLGMGKQESHFHVGNMDEALRIEEERRKTQAMGFDNQ